MKLTEYVQPDLRGAYADWLSQFDWQWLATLTFPDHVHPEQARRKFGRWIDGVNRSAHGRYYRKHGDGVFWALASELQRRGVLHYHALIGDVIDLNTRVSRRESRNRWYQLAGIARIDPITSNMGAVASYLSKYVAKGGDIELSASLVSYRRQLRFETGE